MVWPASPGVSTPTLCPFAQELYLSSAQGSGLSLELCWRNTGFQFSNRCMYPWIPLICILAWSWTSLEIAGLKPDQRIDLTWLDLGPASSPPTCLMVWSLGPGLWALLRYYGMVPCTPWCPPWLYWKRFKSTSPCGVPQPPEHNPPPIDLCTHSPASAHASGSLS